MKISFSIFLFLFFTGLSLNFSYRQKESNPVKNLEDIFRDPPMKSRPYVWWHWMGPNFSKKGITQDLEATKGSRILGARSTNENVASQIINAKWL